MISRVLTASCAAGFLTAVVITVLQVFATTPLILKAETFEKQASHMHQTPAPNAGSGQAEGAEWKPSEGLARAAFTGLATLISGVGYALLLTALLLVAGSNLSVGQTLSWAIGGFLAVNLAPAAGLPPELPGMGGEHLAARQLWWLATVTGTGLGIYLIGVVRAPWAIAAGVAATVVPHVVGAPHGVVEASEVPPMLAAQFAARSLAIAFVFWVVLGVSLSGAWRRLATMAETEAAVS